MCLNQSRYFCGTTEETHVNSHVFVALFTLLSMIIRFVIPVVFINKLYWSVCTGLTQIYDGRYMCRIYYIKNNYVFRHFILAIFRLRNKKNLVSRYTLLIWAV